MRHSRAIFLAIAASLTLSGGLAACGSDKALEAKINALPASEQDVTDGVTATDQTQEQLADEDARDARAALKRRKKLADLEKTQQQETERIMKEGVPGGEDSDSSIPIGSADPAVEEFRAKLAGVCAGGQKRIVKAGEDAQKATKSSDPVKILAAAQSYSSALDLFLTSLGALNPPDGIKNDYGVFVTTVNDLASNVRLQLVSQGDPKQTKKLQAESTKLTARLVEKSAVLGVTCLSATI